MFVLAVALVHDGVRVSTAVGVNREQTIRDIGVSRSSLEAVVVTGAARHRRVGGRCQEASVRNGIRDVNAEGLARGLGSRTAGIAHLDREARGSDRRGRTAYYTIC